MITLRPYQQRAVDELAALVRAGKRRVVMVAPVGAGKGSVAAYLLAAAHAKGSPAAFIVHRAEILDDVYERVRAAGVPRIGMIRGSDKRYDPNAVIQLASIDSLRGKTPPRAKLVIRDEAHRIMSATDQRVLEHYVDAVLLGLTATPKRLDGKELGDTFDAMVMIAQPPELIAQGYIVAPAVYTVPAEQLPDTSAVHTRAGDFDQGELAKAVLRTELVGSIVKHWGERARGKRTVCFAVTIEHSRAIVAQLAAAGVRAVHVDGTTPARERMRARDDLRAHRVDVVSNCGLFVEGVDVVEAKCAILARPTQSLTIYIQSVGRIMRPWNNETAVVLDHAGNARRHGLPQEAREWSLEPRVKRRGGTAESFAVRTCKQCFAVFEASLGVCPACGAAQPPRERVIEHAEGDLVQITEEEARRAFFDRQWAKVYDQGYEPSYAARAFKDRYGETPPHAWVPPPRPKRAYTAQQKEAFLKTLRIIAHRQGKDWAWVERRYSNKFGESVPRGAFADDAPLEVVAPESETKVIVEGEF